MSSSGGFILYINLWGATAKLIEAEDGGVIFNPEDLIPCQVHFIRTLSELAVVFPQIEIRQMGDYAYASSPQLKDLADFVSTLFKRMTLPDDRFALWPLRAGIAEGHTLHKETHFPTPLLAENFVASPFLGVGAVEAARFEKSGQKGMRVFLSPDSGERLLREGAHELRLCRTRGIEHYELNWMQVPAREPAYLDVRVQGKTVEEHFIACAETLIQVRSNFCQQLSAALRDLVRWTQESRAANQD